MREKKFDLKDITLVPAVVSTVKSRKECNTAGSIQKGCLPLITSPMDTVISKDNVNSFILNGIVPCLSRGDRYQCLFEPFVFHSFGLQEIEEQLMFKDTKKKHFSMFSNVLIDIANGHLERLVEVVKKIKEEYPDVKLMVGNVGHPLTYKNLAMAGADYVRCSIGTGCFTPGQIIKLNDNEKNIEDIQIGDEVLTHKNEYQKVKNKFEYEIAEEIYKVNNISCTKTHEFYIIEKQYKDIVNDENIEEYAKWISAEELDKEKHLLIEY